MCFVKEINESLIFKSVFKFDDPNRYLAFTNPSIKFMFLKLYPLHKLHW